MLEDCMICFILGRISRWWPLTVAPLSFGCSQNSSPAFRAEPDAGLKGDFAFYQSTDAIPQEIRNAACMDALLVDLDLDEDLDVVLAIEFGPNVVLVNDGQGTFTLSATLPTTNRDSEDALAFDSDGDGDLDLFFVSEDDQVNELFINTSTQTELSLAPAPLAFELSALPLPAAGVSNGAALVDVNGDGRLDVLLANAGPNFLFVANDSGGFSESSADLFPDNDATTQDVEVGDVDGDGDLDIIWANEGQNELWLFDGQRYQDATTQLPRLNDESREADLADLDSDGDLDIVIANVQLFTSFEPQNQVLLNDGTGTFSILADALPANGLSTFDIDLADLNGDAVLDLVEANWRGRGAGPFKVFLGRGDGAFSPLALPSLDFEEAGLDVEIADLNGDGKLDLYLCSRGGIGSGGSRDHVRLRR